MMAIMTGDLSLDFVYDILTSEFTTKFPYNKWILQNNQPIINNYDTSHHAIVFNQDILKNATQIQDFDLGSSMKLYSTNWKEEDIYILSIPLNFNEWDLQISFKKADILHSYERAIHVLQLF